MHLKSLKMLIYFEHISIGSNSECVVEKKEIDKLSSQDSLQKERILDVYHGRNNFYIV